MEYFAENKKLFSFKGVIGRRDFLVTYLVVAILTNLFYQTPLFYYVLKNPELIKTLSGANLPVWGYIMMITAGILSGLLLLPAVVRRFRDILGEENNNKIYLLAMTAFAIGIISLTPAGMKFGIGFIDIIIDIYLIFKKGAITGNKPKNEIIKFNWGAFFGTWIWGLWNKCYITLLILPLLLTSGGWILFMLVCGLKGNEWAYEKQQKKFDTVDKFHNSQSTQSIIFIFTTPIISIICIACLAFGSFSVLHKYLESHPQTKTLVIQQLMRYQLKATEANFDNIEITDNEYRFYINPTGWNKMNDGAKRIFFEHALNYVLIKNNQYLTKSGDIGKYLDLAQKTKVFSTFNNEVLIEFSPTEDELKKLKEYSDNQDFQSLWELRKNCIKMNKTPSYSGQ